MNFLKYISKLLFIFVFGLWSYTSKAQDHFVNYEIEYHNHPNERIYLEDQAIAPFLLLQSLDPLAEREDKRWIRLLKKLDKVHEKYGEDPRFLSEIFFLTHQELLRKYQQISNLSSTIKKGKYDCVTGTAVYAILLDRYEISYALFETKEHVYLRGEFLGEEFIFESTYPEDGFITGTEKISEFEWQFSALHTKDLEVKSPQVLGGISLELSTKTFRNTIDLRQLAGLQYYNDAIKEFYDKNFFGSYSQLVKASILYPSERILDLKGKMELLLGIVSLED